MLNNDQIKQILDKAEIMPAAEFDKFAAEAKSCNKKIENYLIEKKIITAAAFYESAANFFKVPFLNLKDQIIRKDVLFSIPEPIASTHKLVAFASDDKEIKIATLDPEDLEIFEFIKKKTNLEPKIYLTTPEGIDEVLKQYHKSLQSEFKDLASEQTEAGADENLKKLAANLPIVRIVDTLLEYAIFEGASDIHIEPEEKDIIVRYRVDGILRNVMTLPKNVQSGIIARIKILANLKVDEHHTIEDTAIALGDAFLQAIENKKAIQRYGFLLPMDDCLAQVAVDIGGRSFLVWNVSFSREKIGNVPTEMFFHFFKSFSDQAKCNLNIKAEGVNEHHKIEAVFKAFAKALKMAVCKTENYNIPSTKGSL